MSPFEPWLTSTETGKAFSHCIRCKLPLLEIASPWMINKDFHKGECTLEYAICEGCRDQMSEEFSEESKEAVRNFLENEIPWEDRLKEFVLDHEARFKQCVACSAPRELLESYASSVLMSPSGEIDFGPLPLLICSNCSERMTEQLSEATRESWQRFLDEHFDSPPKLSSLPGLL